MPLPWLIPLVAGAVQTGLASLPFFGKDDSVSRIEKAYGDALNNINNFYDKSVSEAGNMFDQNLATGMNKVGATGGVAGIANPDKRIASMYGDLADKRDQGIYALHTTQGQMISSLENSKAQALATNKPLDFATRAAAFLQGGGMTGIAGMAEGFSQMPWSKWFGGNNTSVSSMKIGSGIDKGFGGNATGYGDKVPRTIDMTSMGKNLSLDNSSMFSSSVQNQPRTFVGNRPVNANLEGLSNNMNIYDIVKRFQKTNWNFGG